MQTQQIQETIEKLFNAGGFSVDEISIEQEGDNGHFWCKIKSPDPGFLIGKNGETLSAFNHVVRRITEKQILPTENSDFQPINITVDINNYQKNRIENIKVAAHMLSERAIFFKSNIEADPMSSYDRRIVHEFLSEKSNIKTESIGEGRNRHVVIKYVE